MTNRFSSFGVQSLARPLPRLGRVRSASELAVSPGADTYVVEGNASIRSIAPMPQGTFLTLRFTGTPTLVNSAKLICHRGYNIVIAAADLVFCISEGDGVWRAYVVNAGNKPRVVFASGQSNFALNPSYSSAPPSNLRVWNGGGVDGIVGTAFIAADATTINPAVSFAAQLAREDPSSVVFLVNVSIAGIPIAKWMTGGTSPDMFGNIAANMAVAMPLTGVSTVEVGLWWQGENDVDGTETAGNYLTNFESLFGPGGRFQTQSWWPHTTPIMVLGVNATANNGDARYDRMREILRAAAHADPEIRKFIDSGARLGSSFWIDTAHGTAAGYDAIGIMAAREHLHGSGIVKAAATALDALAFTGLQINGNHVGSQEIGDVETAAIAAASSYLTDQHYVVAVGTLAVKGSRIASGLSGTPYALRIKISTAEASLAAGSFLKVGTRIEGTRFARNGFGTTGASPLSVIMSVRCSITGTFYVWFANAAGDRTIYKKFTVNAANTWETKVFFFEPDITGTWLTDTGVGLNAEIILAAGSTFRGSAPDVWAAFASIAGTDQTNLAATLNNTFDYTNLFMVPGAELPSIYQLPRIMRPLNGELPLSKRYWQKTYPHAVLPGANNGAGALYMEGTGRGNRPFFKWDMPVEMRAAPTCTGYSVTGASGKYRNITTVADQNITFYDMQPTRITAYPADTPAAGDHIGLHVVANARL